MFYPMSIEDWRFCRSLHLRHARAGKRTRAYLRRRHRQGLAMERYDRSSEMLSSDQNRFQSRRPAAGPGGHSDYPSSRGRPR